MFKKGLSRAELRYGWVGKILRVDLTTARTTDIPTSRYVPEFIGGRALGAKIYWDEVAPEIEAYAPENRLIFMTGPAVGTLSPSPNRVFVTGKSPIPYPRECYFYSSMGGHWGAELKFAGYDGLILQGKSPEPTYLWIHDGVVEIRDARGLWGMISRDAQLAIRKSHGETTRSVVIGPAGENLCREAIITSDTAHAAGQGGFGAVMGSKKLKAIAVRGSGGVTVAKPAELMELYDYFARLATCRPGEGRQNPVRYMKYYTRSLEGASGGHDNYEADDSAIGEEVAKGLVKRRSGGCFTCPVSCLVGWQFNDGSIPGGAGCCNENKFCIYTDNARHGGKPISRTLIEAARLHDDLGLSVTQTGFKYEYEWFSDLVKGGILTSENTGLPIDQMGSSEFWKAYLGQIARREGIGALMAGGEERFFVDLLKMIPENLRDRAQAVRDRWLPKGGYGYFGHWGGGKLDDSLSVVRQATAARTDLQSQTNLLNPNAKACYLSSEEREKTAKVGAQKYFGGEDVLKKFTFESKIPAAIYIQDFSLVSDSVTYCRWSFPKPYSWYTSDHLGDVAIGSKILSAVTGMKLTENDVLKTIGERGWNLERMIMVREGRRRQHDQYNDAVFEQNESWLNRKNFITAMDDYYRTRGWDLKEGIPTRRKLEELGLTSVADELEKKYKVRVPV